MVEINDEPNPQGQGHPTRLTRIQLRALDAQYQQQEGEQEAGDWEEVSDHNDAPSSPPSSTIVTRAVRRPIAARYKDRFSVKGNLRARRSARAENVDKPSGRGRGRGRGRGTTEETRLGVAHEKLPRLFLSVLIFSVMLIGIWKTMNLALRPVCQLPLVSKTDICAYINYYDNEDGRGYGKLGFRLYWADFPTLTDVQTKSMGKLLEESAQSTELSLEIKKAEVAAAGLITVVEQSGLQSKVTLMWLLKDFVKNARVTGKGLQKFDARVAGAVDQIAASNDHALRTIEATQATLPKPGSLGSYMPWAPDPTDVDMTVTRTFADTMNIVSGELVSLTIEAQDSLQNLAALGESLGALNTLVRTEGIIQTTKREEISKEILPHISDNLKKLRKIRDHFMLLRKITAYRKQATAHVQGALYTLGVMSHAIEELRDRVAAPRLLANVKSSEGFQSDVEDIPVHLHIKSIQMGLERLEEGKVRAKILQQAVVSKILEDDLGYE